MSGRSAGGRPSQRADARRNATRITEAARTAFASQGPEASLIEIARTAGVGSATLYRHFPTREALLAAVYQHQIEELAAGARTELTESASPWEALITWLHAVASHLATHRGLKGLLISRYEDQAELFTQCRRTLCEAATELLTAAQDCGAVRRDVDAYRMLKMVSAVVLANEQSGDDDEIDLLLGLVIDGLRRHDDPRSEAATP